MSINFLRQRYSLMPKVHEGQNLEADIREVVARNFDKLGVLIVRDKAAATEDLKYLTQLYNLFIASRSNQMSVTCGSCRNTVNTYFKGLVNYWDEL